MKSGDATAFGAAVAVALATGALGAWTEAVSPRRAPRPPLLAPTEASRPVPVSRALREAEDRRAWAIEVFGPAVPAFAHDVTIHLRRSTDAPWPADADGPTAHWILKADGTLETTPRYRAGKTATPPGTPPDAARRSLHLVVDAADVPSASRDARARAFWTSAAERFGASAVRFAFELPGATVSAPEAVDVSAFVGDAPATRKARR